jgi:hypothetical protein
VSRRACPGLSLGVVGTRVIGLARAEWMGTDVGPTTPASSTASPGPRCAAPQASEAPAWDGDARFRFAFTALGCLRSVLGRNKWHDSNKLTLVQKDDRAQSLASAEVAERVRCIDIVT